MEQIFTAKNKNKQAIEDRSMNKWNYSSAKTKFANNFNPICQATQQLTLKGKFLITSSQKKSIPGKLISVQIYSGTEVDPSEYIFFLLHTQTHVNILLNEKHNILLIHSELHSISYDLSILYCIEQIQEKEG